MSQAHKLNDNIHDIDLSSLDAKTVSEVSQNYNSKFCHPNNVIFMLFLLVATILCKLCCVY